MSFDLSGKTDLVHLAVVVRALQSVAQPMSVDFLLIGAAARDVLLRHVHNIPAQRLTEDVDFAVTMIDWKSFADLRAQLLANGEFTARPGSSIHGLRHQQTGLPLDIVPFGGVERADRTIAWPPDQSPVFDCFGVKEAFAVSVAVQLPEDVVLRVAPIPALALLKITAWRDRQSGKDASDLLLFMASYMDCNNLDRASCDHADLFHVDDYDHEAAGARLLGRDIASMLGQQSCERILGILIPEADADGTLLLASQSGRELEKARRLIEAVCDGLTDII